MVTPELVEPLDANQVPPCGPGMEYGQPERLGVVLQGTPGSARLLSGRGTSGCPGGRRGADRGGRRPPPAPAARRPPPARPLQPLRRRPIRTIPTAPNPAQGRNPEPPFIGPIGYDVVPALGPGRKYAIYTRGDRVPRPQRLILQQHGHRASDRLHEQRPSTSHR